MTQPQFGYGVASLRTGELLRAHDPTAQPEQLIDLAATLPEIFSSGDSGCLERIATHLGAEKSAECFTEVLFLSDSHVHVIQPLVARVGEALVATSPAGRSVGLVLSQAHAQVAKLEAEP